MVEVLRQRIDYEEDRNAIAIAMEKSGLFSRKGTTKDQREWIKERDGYRCQFYGVETLKSGDVVWTQCPRKIDPLNPMPRNSLRWELQVHHIYPQYMQKKHPKPYGGENPYNLITLCAGKSGEVGHHDYLQPTMIIAKMKYKYDRWAYDSAIELAHQAIDRGVQVYDTQFDYMLKEIARTRTTLFLRQNPDRKFPRHPIS